MTTILWRLGLDACRVIEVFFPVSHSDKGVYVLYLIRATTVRFNELRRYAVEIKTNPRRTFNARFLYGALDGTRFYRKPTFGRRIMKSAFSQLRVVRTVRGHFLFAAVNGFLKRVPISAQTEKHHERTVNLFANIYIWTITNWYNYNFNRPYFNTWIAYSCIYIPCTFVRDKYEILTY